MLKEQPFKNLLKKYLKRVLIILLRKHLRKLRFQLKKDRLGLKQFKILDYQNENKKKLLIMLISNLLCLLETQ